MRRNPSPLSLKYLYKNSHHLQLTNSKHFGPFFLFQWRSSNPNSFFYLFSISLPQSKKTVKMLKVFLPLFVIFVFSVSPSFADDSSVMSELQKNLKPSGWDTTKSYCSWNSKQIHCDSSGRVTELNLAQLSLSGTLPSDLNQLTNLEQLSLQGNSLTGEIPSLANMSNLQSVYLDDNKFSSIASGAFDGLNSLLNLSLTGNSKLVPWTLPSSLSQASSLQRLEAGNANLMGSIPDIFRSLTNLNSLRLSYNNLTGGLPPSFAGSGIQNLWLNNQDQGLSGTLDVLGSMQQLSQAWLHVNSFTGGIPDLSNCTSLDDLQLRDNQLTGIVPTSLTGLKSLTSVSLQNNKLMGPVPVFTNNGNFTIGQWNTSNNFCTEQGPCDSQVTALLNVAGALGYPQNLVSSWQGNDACNNWGAITCETKNVTSVNFGKRGFVGYISPSFSDLSMLKSLYLNDNNLTGPIPESLTTLSHLQTLDVLNNNLTGPLPKFPATLTKFVISGNPYINTTVSPNGSPSGDSSSSSGSSSGSSTSAGAIAGIVVGVLVCLGLLLFVSYRLYAKKKHEKFGKVGGSEDRKDVMSIGKPGLLNVYNGVPSELQSQSSAGNNELQVFEGGNVVIQIQVLRQVTNNFSEDNILGRGGFGVVYKGELHDGTQIAVKRMESNDMGNKGLNEFKAEIAVLTKVRHRHLVALLGYCINGNERLLVYEYMPQGHLGEHLFDYMNLGYPPLTWKQRVTTALDVARGVEYLHSLARESFIHRDLKPSNILLGDDMRAKVSDFGLVKNAPDGKYSLETKLAGTFGYLAPEYAATGRVTTKVDVYAFGVILMELLTGRRALDDTQPEERAHLVAWFRRVLISKEDISNFIDPALDPDEDTLESIKKVAELAGHCTARESYQRPDMGHAVNVLGPLVEQWKPSCQEEDETYGIDLHLSLPQALQRWQDEGTSTMASGFYHTRTESQSSIPDQPSEFNTFNSSKAR